MATPLIPPILSYENINEHAENFLRTHKVEDKLPVPIEEIIEFNLKMDIVPFPGLQKDFDVEGFISGDLTCIYVDDLIFQKRPARYRFTLAHEVGHFVLHKDLIRKIHPKSIHDWKDFILRVDPDVYSWLEWQAYTFAGLLLVPRKFLFKDFSSQIRVLKKKIGLAKFKNLPKDSYREYVIDSIASKLIRKYEVSVDVLTKRINKEIEKGGLKIP